jgi:Lon protease-like protein
MATIGLFPLELALVPTERVPLHVFEPRYKELVGECIERGEEFGIVLVKDNGDLHHVGTRAAVADVLQVLRDGRMHVIVEGRERFRLLEIDHERSFDTATIEEVVDEDDPPDTADFERVHATFARLQQTVGAPGEPPDPTSPLFDFEVVARVDFAGPTKQELLELTSPRLRLKRLAVLLERAVSALEIDQQLRRRAHGNGKVSPPAGT